MGCLMLAAGATRAVSQPDLDSANELIPACKALLAQDSKTPLLKADFLQGVCVGQVSGVWDAAIILNVVCSPPEVIKGQGVRVVVQFIDARPARMHERFAVLALEALTAAWPCK